MQSGLILKKKKKRLESEIIIPGLEIIGTHSNVQNTYCPSCLVCIYMQAQGIVGTSKGLLTKEEGIDCTPSKIQTMPINSNSEHCHWNQTS